MQQPSSPSVVSAYASTIAAQAKSDLVRLEIVSVDADGAVQNLPVSGVPVISDTGAVVAYETTAAAPGNASSSVDDRQVWIRDRDGRTSRALAEPGSTAPGISGDGCVVAYSVIVADEIRLTVIDRCATAIELQLPKAPSPLPNGLVLDAFTLEPPASAVDPGAIRVGAPALSFDGSTIAWSTGRDVRRYDRPAAGGPHELTYTFDAGADGSPAVATGHQVDISADGNTVVFVAGPGTTSFEPVPANVYVWAPVELEPVTELTFATSSGDPGAFSSTSPTISSDGRFVVFEAMRTDPVVVGSTPFVVRADLTDRAPPILVDDATRPTVSADGKHVVYQRDAAIRVRSFGATTTEDVDIVELASAQPTGPAAISQFGRWLVFASATELDPARPVGAPVVWAADRSSSDGGTVDTTTTTTTSTPPLIPPVTQPPAASPTVPASTGPEVTSSPTIPATTLLPTVVVARFPTVGIGLPSVSFPATPRRPATSSSSTFRPGAGSAIGGAAGASASSAAFGPTVVDAGRRTQPVTLTNASASAVQIGGASIDVPEAFAIVSDGCRPDRHRVRCRVPARLDDRTLAARHGGGCADRRRRRWHLRSRRRGAHQHAVGASRSRGGRSARCVR